MKSVKSLLKSLAASHGYEVRRKQRASSSGTRFPVDPFAAQSALVAGPNTQPIVILDVGANRGQTAIEYVRLFPNSRIYCFEPYPSAADEVSRRFTEDDRVTVIQKAVSDSAGNTQFFLNEADATNSLLPRPRDQRRYFPSNAKPTGSINVESITLDEFLGAASIPHVDILKLDIQGGELAALRGAATALTEQRVSLIYTEVMFTPHYEGACLFHELATFLAEYDYSLFDLYHFHNATNGQLRYGDALFVSPAIRKDTIDRAPPEP